MKKVTILALFILLVSGVVQAQDNVAEVSVELGNVELAITDFRTLYAGMNIIFYDVVDNGQVVDSYWTRWYPEDTKNPTWTSSSPADTENPTGLELQITDFRTLYAGMNIIFYDVVVDGWVIDSYWTRWYPEE